MADSDNTTTRPLITRRRLLAGTAIAIAGWKPNAFAGNDLQADQFADPAIAVWRKWQIAREHTEQLCRQQQRLERKLVETIGFPCATIRVREEHVRLHSIQAIRKLVSLGSEGVARRSGAEVDFAAHQARWDAADKEIGYSATLQAEREAADRAEDLLGLLSGTPAASLAGVAAKLDAVLKEGESSDCDGEFPWPQIRSVFEDIHRLSSQPFPEGSANPQLAKKQGVVEANRSSPRKSGGVVVPHPTGT
ncbi:hypothetical protein [Mesorhizobium sp.]|uniref:hypothetical protein n=1 Tax=Mesorhizobium sp. TaxID=1871066 RepID=UPI0025E26FB8|nr:hypothetical protein [Mesorhizobium sp.]